MPSDTDDPLLELFQEELLEMAKENEFDQEVTQEKIQEIGNDVIKNVGVSMYEEVRDDSEGLSRLYETKAEFERGIEQRWGEPLELLERFIVWSREAGQAINSEHRFDAVQEQDFEFDALTRLHARATQVAMEIHHLLKGGFADGAFARWRSLHELSITTLFIAQSGEATAEHFLSYRYLWEYYFAQTYQEYSDELDAEEIASGTIESLEEDKEELIDRFGSEFDDNGYGTGWAAEAYDRSGGPSIRGLQDEVELDHYQPYYRLASESVHGGSKGTLDRLGIIDIPDVEQPDVLLAGPSNAGLSLPGQLTAISLSQITFAFMNWQSSTTRTAEMVGMQQLIDDLIESFAKVSEELEQDEREAREEWTDQDIIDIALNYIGAPVLLTDEFLSENTKFKSRSEFENSASISIDKVTDLEALPPRVNDIISANSEFDSTGALIEASFENWVRQEVDLSEFDTD